MQRNYYITSDLDDLETIEQELQHRGLTSAQLNVLSEQDADVEQHHLHAIESVLKKDVVRSTELGAIYGLIAASLVLLITWLMGWYQSEAGWLPFIFLAVVMLGFCTWEGGLIGIQVPNYQFKRFQKMLAQGNHVFFVDYDVSQQQQLDEVVSAHPSLKLAGSGPAAPVWVVRGQDTFHKFMKAMP